MKCITRLFRQPSLNNDLEEELSIQTAYSNYIFKQQFKPHI